MKRMELHCPICHHLSGNAIVADWPEPVEQRCYGPLICVECGIDFEFAIDRNGMRSTAKRGSFLLEEFLKRRPGRPKVRNA